MSAELSTVNTLVQVQGVASEAGWNYGKVKGEESDSLVTKVSSSWLYLVALAGVGTAAASYILVASIYADIAAISLMVVAPIAIIQKQRLSNLGTLREKNNAIRENVNKIFHEKAKLSAEVADLKKSIDQLKTVEKEFEAVSKTAGGQVDNMVKIIEENGEIQEKITKSLKTHIRQEVIKYAMKADRNKNFKYSKKELRELKLRLDMPGIDFDAAAFERVTAERELTLTEIMKMFRNMDDGNAGEDNIFKIDLEKLKEKKRSMFSSPFKK